MDKRVLTPDERRLWRGIAASLRADRQMRPAVRAGSLRPRRASALLAVCAPLLVGVCCGVALLGVHPAVIGPIGMALVFGAVALTAWAMRGR